MDLSDEWEGNCGRAYISPEKLKIIAEVLKAAAPQPNPNIAEQPTKIQVLQNEFF